MATLCTYADAKEFPDLCEALGDRLEEKLQHEGKPARILEKDATFCYLAGSKLEKVVTIWITESQETESAGLQDSSQGLPPSPCTPGRFKVSSRKLRCSVKSQAIGMTIRVCKQTGSCLLYMTNILSTLILLPHMDNSRSPKDTLICCRAITQLQTLPRIGSKQAHTQKPFPQVASKQPAVTSRAPLPARGNTQSIQHA